MTDFEDTYHPKMDAEVKVKWLEALRSGEYLQGQHELIDDACVHFCCIGVLGKVMGIDDKIMLKERHMLSFTGLDAYDGDKTGLSLGERTTLSGMNDNGDTFLQIADYIEEHL